MAARDADSSPASDPAWRQALVQTGVAAALIDGAGCIAWRAPAFERLGAGDGATPARDGRQPLVTALGAQAAPLLDGRRALGLLLVTPEGAATRWRARLEPLAPAWRLLTLHPQDDAAQLRERVARLEERIDLVQDLCNAGFFERDPVTLEGHWDAQMYRIFGLPVPPPGTPAPHYDETTRLVVAEDRTQGGLPATLSTPGKHGDRFRVRRADGSVRHVRSRWRVVHDAQGRPTRVLGVDIDDTEEVELAERALRLREELDAVLRLGSIAVWRRDLATGRVFFDEHGYRLTGLVPRPEGLAQEEARAVIHPDDAAKVDASASETLRTGQPSDMTLRYRRPEGGWRHLLSRRALLRDAQGEPVAFIGVLLDETERVAQARQGQELAQRLEAAAEAARIGLWSARDDGARPAWNGRMFDLLGLAADQPALRLGEWLRRCVHPDDRQRAGARLVPWSRDGVGSIEVEFRCLRADGASERWLVARGAVEVDAATGARRVEGVLMDITEHKQALLRLREAAERVELASAAVGLGVWEIPGPGQPGRWDANMFRLRGVQSEPREVSTDEIASFLDPQDRDAVMAEQSAWLGSGLPWRRELRIRRPDGKIRWLASWSSPILDADGREQRRIGLNWDITEVREAEEVMRERERAVAESRAKSRLMSRVSHELRTPLNAVLGFTQLLREGAAADDAERRARWLEHIDGAGRHLLELIDDVLDLSRADAGELRMNLQPVALQAAVRAALPMLAAAARERDVALADPDLLPGVVSADPVRLRQVLLNLLSNAIKYNRPGGRVWVQSERVQGGVRLSVCDSGRGIAEERLHDVFEPFNRLGAEASSIEGTGIGLAIVKALVEAMHGSVAVRSRPGEGTVFDVTLPGASDAAPSAAFVDTGPAAAPLPNQRAPGASRVLYVEDDEINALLVHELLATREGFILDEAATGAEGLAKARALHPDLILLDMQLPDMDGLAVLRALRADPATAATPCVALSANAMPQDIEAARAAGFDAYWTKPIDFAAFLGGIDRVLGRTD
ncbi:MAG: PAS domain-containing protein [Piscinibacter sp.]|nr:PAS domain-containing protein [Piscinibacter sp.]